MLLSTPLLTLFIIWASGAFLTWLFIRGAVEFVMDLETNFRIKVLATLMWPLTWLIIFVLAMMIAVLGVLELTGIVWNPYDENDRTD